MGDHLSIKKYNLWKYVNIKIKRATHRMHVLGVISILFEEIIADLKNGKPLKIFNFGTLELKDTPPRRYFHVFKREMQTSPGYKILRFTLAPKIRKKILRHLDIEKTFKDD